MSAIVQRPARVPTLPWLLRIVTSSLLPRAAEARREPAVVVPPATLQHPAAPWCFDQALW